MHRLPPRQLLQMPPRPQRHPLHPRRNRPLRRLRHPRRHLLHPPPRRHPLPTRHPPLPPPPKLQILPIQRSLALAHARPRSEWLLENSANCRILTNNLDNDKLARFSRLSSDSPRCNLIQAKSRQNPTSDAGELSCATSPPLTSIVSLSRWS